MLPIIPEDLSFNSLVAGVDEAGRGSLAGNVYAGCVVLPSEFPEGNKLYESIKDSKKLSAKKRDQLKNYITSIAVTWGVGYATPEEIDQVNILQATYLAMHRAIKIAYDKLDSEIDKERFELIIDGPKFKPYYNNESESWISSTCIENADNKYMCVAAASILAKTFHDEHIREIVETCPDLDTHYGLLSNMAYGTKTHIEGLKKYGATEYHRKSYAPVKKCLKFE